MFGRMGSIAARLGLLDDNGWLGRDVDGMGLRILVLRMLVGWTQMCQNWQQGYNFEYLGGLGPNVASLQDLTGVVHTSPVVSTKNARKSNPYGTCVHKCRRVC